MSKFKNLSRRSQIILITSLLVVVCLILAVGSYFFILSKALDIFYEPDLIISSPNGKYELVIREFSCLGGAGAEIYIREPGQDKCYNSWMEKKVGRANTDDYYHPFSNGTYHVEWEHDKVTLCYYQGLDIENVDDRSTWRGVVSYEFV